MNATDTTSAPRRRRPGPTRGYRLAVLSRSLAAIVGGFLLASAAAWLLAAGLAAIGAQPQAFAVHSGTLLSWLVWCGGAMWAFYAPTQRAAWLWLLAPAAAFGGLALLITNGS